MMQGHISLMDSDLQSIRSPVDSSAALIGTLIDVGKLFPGSSIQTHDIIQEDIATECIFLHSGNSELFEFRIPTVA